MRPVDPLGPSGCRINGMEEVVTRVSTKRGVLTGFETCPDDDLVIREPAPKKARRKNLKGFERRAVIHELLQGSRDGTLCYGDLKRVANMFGISWHSVSRLWRNYTTQKSQGILDPNLDSKRKGNSGRKGVNIEELKEKLSHIPQRNRTSQRALAAQLGIPKSTLSGNLEKLGVKHYKKCRRKKDSMKQ